jgi:hypothetical protein
MMQDRFVESIAGESQIHRIHFLEADASVPDLPRRAAEHGRRQIHGNALRFTREKLEVAPSSAPDEQDGILWTDRE